MSSWERLVRGLEAVSSPQVFGAAVGVVDGAVDEICPPSAVGTDRCDVVGSNLTWWAGSALVYVVPAFQRRRGVPPHVESASGIQQVGVRGRGGEVFGPQLESQVASEGPRAVA